MQKWEIQIVLNPPFFACKTIGHGYAKQKLVIGRHGQEVPKLANRFLIVFSKCCKEKIIALMSRHLTY